MAAASSLQICRPPSLPLISQPLSSDLAMTVVGELSDSVGAAPAAALGGSRTRGLLILHGLAHSMVVVEEEHIEARALSAPCGRHVVVGSGCPPL
jgi:hypothetical protein